MIPYGLYVFTSKSSSGEFGTATINWVSQTSFSPPLIVAGVKNGSTACTIAQESGTFALNILGKKQQHIAFSFFKPVEVKETTLNGEPFKAGTTGAPVLQNAPACIECKLIEVIEQGDHAIFVGEVIDVHLTREIEGRPDDATLTLKDLGESIFYGG